MLLVSLLLPGLLALGCTHAPAPCASDEACGAEICVNGACVSPLDPQPEPQPTPEPQPQPTPEPEGDRDAGVRDAFFAMDAAPGCEHLGLRVALPADVQPLRRDEPVRLTVQVADGASLEYSSSADGVFVEEPGGAQWIARDDVIWPWHTGPIDLTVRATLDECVVSDSVRITLLGDLMVGDGTSGQLNIIGSNGSLYGQWRLVDATGISALARAPDGGYLVGIRGPYDGNHYSAPAILRLDANGRELLRFSNTSIVDASPLLTRPARWIWVVGDEVVVSGTQDPATHVFSLDGRHLRSVSTDDVWTVAVAPWNDSLAIAQNADSRIYTPDDMGGVRAIGQADEEIEGLHPLLDGGVLVVGSRSEDVLERLDPDGRITAVPPLPNGYGVSAITPFDDGYAILSRINYKVRLLTTELESVEDDDLASIAPTSPRGLLWLDGP